MARARWLFHAARHGTVGLVVGVVLTGAVLVGAVAAMGSREGAVTRGTMPENPTGPIDRTEVPDLISVEDDSGRVVGFARAGDLAPPDGSAPAPIVKVWDERGAVLMGHVFPDGVGYLSLGEQKRRGVSPDRPPTPSTPPTTVQQ